MAESVCLSPAQEAAEGEELLSALLYLLYLVCGCLQERKKSKDFECFKITHLVATCLGDKRIMGKEKAAFRNGTPPVVSLIVRLSSRPSSRLTLFLSCLMMSLPQQHPLSYVKMMFHLRASGFLLSKCSFLLLLRGERPSQGQEQDPEWWKEFSNPSSDKRSSNIIKLGYIRSCLCDKV